MSSEFVQNIVIRVRADGTAVVGKLSDDFKGLGSAATKAKPEINQFSEALGQFGAKLMTMAAGIMTVQKVIEGLRAGMRHFDEINTLNAGLASMLGSWEKGAEAMRRFELESKTTRYGAMELARMFRDVFPLAVRAGMDPTALQTFTVNLARVATVTGHTAEQLTDAFRQLLTGHVRAGNELLMAMGIRIEDFAKASSAQLSKWAEEFLKKAAEGAAMGQSFASTVSKIGDAWADTFAKGMAASAGTTKGLEGMHTVLTDPAVLKAIKDIGEAFGTWLPILARVFNFFAEGFKQIRATARFLLESGQTWRMSEEDLKTLGMGGGTPVWMGGTGDVDLSHLKKKEEWHPPMTTELQQMEESWRQMQAVFKKSGADQFVTDVEKSNQALIDLGKNLDDQAKRVKGFFDETGKWVSGLTQVYRNNAEQIITSVYEQIRVTGKMPEKWKAAFNAAMEHVGGIIAAEDAMKKLEEAEKKALAAAKESVEEPLRQWARWGAAVENVKSSTEQLIQTLKMMPGDTGGYEVKLRELESRTLGKLEAARAGGTLTATEEKAIEDVYARMKKGIIVSAQVAGDEFLKRLERIDRYLTPLKNMFADLFATGGKNFGEIAAQAFTQNVAQAAGDLFGALLEDIGGFGVTRDPKTGMFQVNGEGAKYSTQWQAQIGGLGQESPAAGYAGIGILSGIGGFYSPRGQSDLSTVIGASLAGAQMGGWIGAIVAAVAAGIGKWMQSSVGSEYPYGVPTLKGFGGAGGAPPGTPMGSWYTDPTTGQLVRRGMEPTGLRINWADVQNIPANQLKEMEAKIREQFEEFWSGYMGILMAVGSEFLPKVSDFLYQPTRGEVSGEHGTDFGKAASKNYFSHWDAWISGKLPQEIADVFYTPLEKAFESFGGSADRFKQLWDEWKTLDPKKMLELVTSLFDSLKKVSEAMAYFNAPFMNADPFARGYSVKGNPMLDASSLWNDAVARKYQTAASKIAEIDEKIFDLADNLGDMTSQQQVAAAREIADLVNQRYQLEQEYLQTILGMIEDANRSYEQMTEDFTTATMTAEQKYAYYQGEVERHRQQILTARTPEEAMQAWADYQADMAKLVSAGIEAGVDATELYASAQEFLNTVHTELVNKLIDFGTSIEAMNKGFTERFTPVWDAWLGSIDTSADDLTTLSNSATTASGDLDNFSLAVNDAATAVIAFKDSLSNGGSSSRSGDFETYVRGSRGVA